MRRSRLPIVAALLAAAALAVPAAAQAKLPSLSDTSLTPNVGFAGAKLGQSRAAMKHALGAGDCTDYSCMYTDARRTQLGYLSVSFEDGKRGKVSSLNLSVATDVRTGKPIFRTPLAAITNDDGVGLGSSQRAVKASYPKAKTIPNAPGYLSLVDKHRNQTLFYFVGHRLMRVLIQDDRLRG